MWRDLTRGIIGEYLDDLRNLSDNGRRMRLQPIQQTDRHMATRHGCPRIAEGLNLSRGLAKPVATVYIMDVLDLIAHAPVEFAAGIALQGLAGLRLQEAYRLTWDRVDLKRGLVQISGQVKTAWSERVIPIPAIARDALRTTPRATVRPIHETERVFGRYQTWAGYSNALKAIVAAWNPAVKWAPKDLRKALPTWAAGEGLTGPILEQYLGHAPKGVTARHYVPRLASVTRGEQTELDRAMGQYLGQVVDPLEAWIESENAKEERNEETGFSPFCTQASADA
ncbi:site-specific integrase [bacterium]|nr:site-specific integrase [bacterium]